MCGIAGIVDFNSNSNSIEDTLLKEMSKPLRYRGPDNEGFHIDNNSIKIGLIHRRLSIIDLSNIANQPMISNDGDVVIVFNGEIYNYKTIKSKISNINFITNSDTEVILNAYLNWGIDKTLEELDGMFAFTIVDKKKQEVYIARDRFGEKPIYFNFKNNRLIFSSDIRSFEPFLLNQDIDELALANFLSEMCTPNDISIYKEIKKIPPASYYKFSSSGIDIKEYWKLNYKSKKDYKEAYVLSNCETLIENSVKQKLTSDVPVGCFLSGGIDSTLVSLYAARHYNGKINTFSVGFEYEKFNELKYAKQVAKKINSNHHEIIIDPTSLDVIDLLIEEYGEPFADSSQIPSYYVSKFASDNVKVVLGGDGGDEVFAGYKTYNQGLRMKFWYDIKALLPIIKLLPNNKKVNYIMGIMSLNPEHLGSALYRSMGFSNDELSELLPGYNLGNKIKQFNSGVITDSLNYSDNPFDVLLHSSIKTRLVNDYLVKTDRASMFNSLELRTPFLDRNLIEFTSKLKAKQLIKGGVNKYITKKIAEQYFSKEFIYRPKMGFGIPIGTWMKKEWKSRFEEVLFNNSDSILPINQEFVKKLWKEHLSNLKDHSHKLWIIYVLKKWEYKVVKKNQNRNY